MTDIKEVTKAVVTTDSKTLTTHLNKSQERQLFITCFLVGAQSLMTYQVFMNAIPSIFAVLYSDVPNLVDSIVAVYFTTVLVFSAAAIFHPFLYPKIIYCTAASVTVLAILLPIICTYATSSSISIILHIYVVIMGMTNGGSSVCAFNFGSLMPYHGMSSLSSGMGLAGLLPATVWLLLKVVIFPESTQRNIIIAMSINSAFTAAIAIAAAVSWYFFLQKPWASAMFIQPEHEIPVLYTDNKYSWVSTYTQIIKRTWPHYLVRIFGFGSTFVAFPLFMPLAWNTSPQIMDIIIILMQIFDFTGRYLTRWPRFILRENLLFILTCIRICCIPIYIIVPVYVRWAVTDHNATKIILTIILAVTNGWYPTCSAIYVPRCNPDQDTKKKASSLSLCLAFVGVAAGQWSSRLMKYLMKV